jgi:diguanylate cyclase (GGDEF)-like protein
MADSAVHIQDPHRLLDFARRLANAGFDQDALTYWLTAFVQSLVPHAAVLVTLPGPDGRLVPPPAGDMSVYELRANDREVGVLMIDAPRAQVDPVNAQIRMALEFFAPAVAAAFSLREIETRVVRDALTGLYNRNYALVRLDEEISRARRRNTVVCALLVDIQGLAEINARYGFQTGDNAIRTAAQALRGACRISDVVCRYQADRFLIIYVDMDPNASGMIARRAREQVESRNLPVPGGAIGMKTFAGIACSTHETLDAASLVTAADAELQGDKQARKH